MTACQICVSVEYCRPHSRTNNNVGGKRQTLVPKLTLCMTIGYVTPRGKHACEEQKRKLKRAGQTSRERSNSSPTVGLEIGHDGPATGVGRARRTVPRTVFSHNVSGSLTIPCGPSRICDGDWMGQSPFAPQFATLVNFSFLVRPASQRAVGF